jgi:hypothetical protein
MESLAVGLWAFNDQSSITQNTGLAHETLFIPARYDFFRPGYLLNIGPMWTFFFTRCDFEPSFFFLISDQTPVKQINKERRHLTPDD